MITESASTVSLKLRGTDVGTGCGKSGAGILAVGGSTHGGIHVGWRRTGETEKDRNEQ